MFNNRLIFYRFLKQNIGIITGRINIYYFKTVYKILQNSKFLRDFPSKVTYWKWDQRCTGEMSNGTEDILRTGSAGHVDLVW